MFIEDDFVRVSLDFIAQVIDFGLPEGIFYTQTDSTYIAVDNIRNELFAEEFGDLDNCLKWLRLEPCVDLNGCEHFDDCSDKPVSEKLENDMNMREWISVNDHLPTSEGRFEVTIKGSKGKRYIEMCNYYKAARPVDCWGGHHARKNVIAWRMRDKPYTSE